MGRTRLALSDAQRIALAAALALGAWAAERPPTPEEQEHFLAATWESALKYAQSLPDFLCTQHVHRSSKISQGDGRVFGQRGDVLTVRLGYSSQGEQYTLVAIDGEATNLPYESLGGSTSKGEFGSLLRGVFEPGAGTRFRFQRWTGFGGRRAAVYSYEVPRGVTDYYVLGFRDEASGEERRAHTGLRGNLFIDAETSAVLRITASATDIPLVFPIRSSDVTITYGYAEISGRRYLLPTEAVTDTATARTSHRNRIEFLEYRKFSSDSTLRFESTDSDISYEGEAAGK